MENLLPVSQAYLDLSSGGQFLDQSSLFTVVALSFALKRGRARGKVIGSYISDMTRLPLGFGPYEHPPIRLTAVLGIGSR